jgi:hypothetical protein
MANLTIVAADVHSVRVDGEDGYITGPAAEAITAGQYVRRNVTTGHIELGNGTNAAESRDGGIALNGANIAGITITAQRTGIVDLGDALDALTYDDDVFLSDTDGTLADTAGTVSKIVGTVEPGFGTTTPDKLLRLKDL